MNDTDTTEAAIAACILKAKHDGFVIIYGAKIVQHHARPGVCAMGAYERMGRKAPALSLPRRGYDLSRAYDAIEMGFDGVPATRPLDDDGRPLPAKWLAVGYRLRERFEPMAARALQAENAGVDAETARAPS